MDDQRAELVSKLLRGDAVRAALGDEPTFARLQTELSRHGRVTYLLVGELSACTVYTPDGREVTARVRSRANPAAAALCALVACQSHARTPCG